MGVKITTNLIELTMREALKGKIIWIEEEDGSLTEFEVDDVLYNGLGRFAILSDGETNRKINIRDNFYFEFPDKPDENLVPNDKNITSKNRKRRKRNK